MADPFRRALLDVSKELSDKDLDDLVFICKVPASCKRDIKDGKDLFKYLEERGIIGEQRVEPLKDILKHLRPTRRNLLRVIDEYERSVCEDGKSSITDGSVGAFTLRSMQTSRNMSIMGASPTTERNQKYCSIDCVCITCHGCTIRKPFCCCCSLITFLLFVLMLVIIFWFSGKPKAIYEYMNSDTTRKDIGIIAVVIVIFILVVIILPYLVFHYWRNVVVWYRKKRYRHIAERHSKRTTTSLRSSDMQCFSNPFENSLRRPDEPDEDIETDEVVDFHARSKSVSFDKTRGLIS